jgi:fructoselysine-6-P-deglycase FrlB-like protein
VLDDRWTVLLLSSDGGLESELREYDARVIDLDGCLRQGYGREKDDEIAGTWSVLLFAQLFAYYSSLGRGLNPDHPTKLTKVVQ